jgi:hypothetical protein
MHGGRALNATALILGKSPRNLDGRLTRNSDEQIRARLEERLGPGGHLGPPESR